MLLQALFLQTLATSLVLASADHSPAHLRVGGDFEIQRRDALPVASLAVVSDVASAAMSASSFGAAATTTAFVAGTSDAVASSTMSLMSAPAPTAAPFAELDPNQRGLLDPLLGLLTQFIPPKYLTAPITIYGSFEGHASLPPLASLVAQIDDAIDADLPISALLDNIESEVGALASMVGAIITHEIDLPTASATAVLNIGR